MNKKPVFALFVLLMLAIVMIPAIPVKAWTYQDGTAEDTKWEAFGPRADKLLIKLYSEAEPEWDALARGEIDITDWPLTKPYKELFESNAINPATGLPYSDTIQVLFYGGEYGLRLLDVNNNPNQYLGNPPDPLYPNPVYPNPCSVVEMRQAIAYLNDRGQLDTIIGAGFYAATYTVVPPVMGSYAHPEIRPGGLREDLTYPYSPANAIAKLEAGHFPVGGDGWRYWDMNTNGVKDAGEELNLKFFIRSDDVHRRTYGAWLAAEIEAVGIHVTQALGTSGAARVQWMSNKDAHLYTAGWGLTVDPDHQILWNGDFYWHPGNSYNTAFCNDPLYNEYSYGVMLANTLEEAETNSWLAQERFCEMALSVSLWSYAGSKAMSRYYTGGNMWQPIGDGEDPYRHAYWEGAVNVMGFGIDSYQSFLNMHPRGFDKGEGDMTIRYGFKVPDLKSTNPVYAEWTWDWNVMGLMYDGLLLRNPYNLAEFIPWMAQSYETSTYNHPVYGTSTKVRFTLRPDITWSDGVPVTIADIYFTFVELDDILAARGLPPPWWISNVANILSFSIIDAYNFEVLLDVKAVFATGWIGGNVVLPKHIWKPLAEAGPVQEPGADPNCISQGPYRFAEYEPNAYVLMYANKPGSTVTVSSPFHTGSVPVTSPAGFHRYHSYTYSSLIDGLPLAKVLYDDDLEAISWSCTNMWYSGSINMTVTQTVGSDPPTVYTLDLGPRETKANGFNWQVKKKIVIICVYVIDAGYSHPSVFTIRGVLYGTLKEDISGSTYYDDIGLSTYPFKSQLPTPDIKVDIKDVALAAKAFGSYPGHLRWNTVADLNLDYKIDIKDIAAIAKKFGWVG